MNEGTLPPLWSQPTLITDQNGAVVSRHDYTGFGRDVAETLGNIGGRTPQQ